MTETNGIPARSIRISDEVAARIVQLHIRQVPHTEIARTVGVHRQTVRRIVSRTQALRRINVSAEVERQMALNLYREIQRTAWDAIERTSGRRSPAMLLAEIRQAQQRIDALLGLDSLPSIEEVDELSTFQALVVSVVASEAPELAPAIAAKIAQLAEHGSDQLGQQTRDSNRRMEV